MNFLGEFEIRLDAKGRFKLPAVLKRQLGGAPDLRFVVNRGFEKCLVMYPQIEWEKVSGKVNKLNTFRKKNREFVRYFFRGATEMVGDKTDRLLLPKQLLTYAGITKEVILFGHTNKIEIWDKDRYEEVLSVDPDIYADLADEVMNEEPNDVDL